MSVGPHSYLPTEGLSYDPGEEKYWDAEALQAEIRRVFEVCHGCRMCFKYCDSFPDLFRFIDDNHDGDVGKVTAEETAHVMDECFQCKLCEVQCPYTPADEHEFLLDFPRLVHRYQAQRAKREGVPWSRQVIADADRAGAMARATFGLANVANRNAVHRWFLEKLIGVDRRKALPDFASKTFERWAEDEGHTAEPGGEAVLFQTCFVQNNAPELGRDTLFVYAQNGVDLKCTKGLQCCGMPFWEAGDLDTLRERARVNLDVLEPWVDAGAKVVALNPTCSMVAAAVVDPSEYLWSIRKEDRANLSFASTPDGTVAYHAPCHLRAQRIGFKGRDLIRKFPGAKPDLTMECCGHDGTFAMRVEGYEASIRIGKKAFEGMKSADAVLWSTDCPLAAVQLEQHGGKQALHPMTVLAKAYRTPADGGFDKAVEE